MLETASSACGSQPCVGGLVEITPGVRFCNSKLPWSLETGNLVEMSQVLIHRRGAEDAEKTNELTLRPRRLRGEPSGRSEVEPCSALLADVVTTLVSR